MSNFNVGVITISAVVNTGDLNQTKEELLERIKSHPTTVEAEVTGLGTTEALVKDVEAGTYKEGTMQNYIQVQTTMGVFNIPIKEEKS